MYPDPLIQDIAGVRYPVAPFAKSAIKDKYAILNYRYDKEGKMVALVYEDHVAYKGEKLDFSEYLYQSGHYALAQHVYGKEGNLWKIIWSYYLDGGKKEHEQKISHKFQKIDDVYVDCSLKEFIERITLEIDFKANCVEWED